MARERLADKADSASKSSRWRAYMQFGHAANETVFLQQRYIETLPNIAQLLLNSTLGLVPQTFNFWFLHAVLRVAKIIWYCMTLILVMNPREKASTCEQCEVNG